jgi:hypothetical protein
MGCIIKYIASIVDRRWGKFSRISRLAWFPTGIHKHQDFSKAAVKCVIIVITVVCFGLRKSFTMANTVEHLSPNLQNTLNQIIDRVNASNGGIRVIMLSTAEGVPLGRVYADRNIPLNEDVLSNIESTWAPASKQFPLLNMGKEARIVTAIYDHGETRS